MAAIISVGYYILHVLVGYAKIALHDESIPERTEKWAAPTFLLVIKEYTEQ
jgi:hypothetical protein